MLALLLLVHPLTAATAGASPLRGLQERLGQAQQRLQQLTGQRQTQESVVDRLRGRTQGFAVELGRVEEALFATINRLVQAEAELDQVEQDLTLLEAQIVEKQAAVDARSGVYTTRLRAMYKFTRTSPLEQLLGARDFSEVLQRVTMMQAFTRVDNLLLGQLRTEQADLLRAKEELQRKQALAQALRDEIDLQRVNLALQRTQQATLLEAARVDQGEAESVLSEYDQQARTEQASIASLQVQYQKELEEQERRRLEEQRRQEELRRQQALSQAATATAQAQNQGQLRVQQTAQAAQAGSDGPGGPGGSGRSGGPGDANRSGAASRGDGDRPGGGHAAGPAAGDEHGGAQKLARRSAGGADAAARAERHAGATGAGGAGPAGGPAPERPPDLRLGQHHLRPDHRRLLLADQQPHRDHRVRRQKPLPGVAHGDRPGDGDVHPGAGGCGRDRDRERAGRGREAVPVLRDAGEHRPQGWAGDALRPPGRREAQADGEVR